MHTASSLSILETRVTARRCPCPALAEPPDRHHPVRNPPLAVLKRLTTLPGSAALGRVRPIRAAYDFILGILTPRSVVVQGHLMWLDRRDALELATREVYERTATGIVQREINEGDVVLDIGANIGYYTLLAARLVGPTGQVIAFEPDQTNFALLRKNVEANGYRNVVLVNKAVSDHNGTAELFLNDANPGDHRTIRWVGVDNEFLVRHLGRAVASTA